MPSPVTVSQVHVYPVKSLSGSSVTSARVEPRGLRHDRRWLVADHEGQFLTQRTLPRMALVSARADDAGLTLQAPGLPPVRVPLAAGLSAPAMTVRVWNSECRALLPSPDADTLLSEFLGTPCHLAWMPDSTRRLVPDGYERAEGIVSFADAFPLLLIGEASLRDLNRRLLVPVPMSRFRPNIVVSGTAPFAEDEWHTVSIGGTLFHAVKPCARCALVTVDPLTGQPDGPEPLRTLAEFRRLGDKVVFGQYLIPDAPGAVSVGMPVDALD